MNKNIEHYIFHKENFLDEKYCENTINELNECTWQPHDWYEYPAEIHTTTDDAPETLYPETFPENIDKINLFIIQNLTSAIQEYFVEIQKTSKFKFDWIAPEFSGSDLKFIRYFPGQTMQNHCDHIHSLFDGKKKGVPVLSIIGLLNDDYEGGELILLGEKKINTKKGDLVMFPSNFLYPHKIDPVTKGVRYSYVSWIW
tara:strand:+ start:53 stop:649 length:597 start_codon:yes stop_codon:yes gene_type:complete